MIPLKDSLLVPWSNNFGGLIAVDPSAYGLTAAQVTAFNGVRSDFSGDYNTLMTSRANGTYSQSLTAIKDAAKDALLTLARELYAFVQANTSVSDADKIALGVTPRSNGLTPVPAPTERPGMDLLSVVGRTVSVHIHDAGSSMKRGKPDGAVAAWVYTYAGAEYPSDPTLWQFQGGYNKPLVDINFPNTMASGQQVWVCAAWVNGKNEAGPTSVPISTNVQGGGGASAAAPLKIAA